MIRLTLHGPNAPRSASGSRCQSIRNHEPVATSYSRWSSLGFTQTRTCVRATFLPSSTACTEPMRSSAIGYRSLRFTRTASRIASRPCGPGTTPNASTLAVSCSIGDSSAVFALAVSVTSSRVRSRKASRSVVIAVPAIITSTPRTTSIAATTFASLNRDRAFKSAYAISEPTTNPIPSGQGFSSV